MKMQSLKVEDAVDKILCHDISKIVKGQCKCVGFKKGHIIKAADISDLKSLGKENIYILELDEGDVHEDEAGVRIGIATSGPGVVWKGPSESRVNLFAQIDGLLNINLPALEAINELPDVILATLPNKTVVKKGDMLAGTKVIPLVVPEQTIAAAENICRVSGPIVEVIAYKVHKIGIIVTGNEIYKKRIRDAFGPVLTEKLGSMGQKILRIEYAPDDCELISSKIKKMEADGAGVVLITGGMSVDPDDLTTKAIRLTGAQIEKYGAPALPGAMFMLAYLGDTPVMGIPACGMFFKITILDLILPRLLVGERVSSKDIAALAHGGLCRGCSECHYPNCTFGKGSR